LIPLDSRSRVLRRLILAIAFTRLEAMISSASSQHQSVENHGLNPSRLERLHEWRSGGRQASIVRHSGHG
jgi:hypothetical protein